jgi:hypothetical protein
MSLEATGYRYEVMRSRPSARTFSNQDLQQVCERMFIEKRGYVFQDPKFRQFRNDCHQKCVK